uniref:F-box/LRR-repeat protein At3g26922-like n=1 Tax=Fragaria vesca subsp. vesca TaxID=101020 RepID=UPI0005C84720|nr:PREDICTED: F-box/LRR-repeat protein At3g26922-like [Fragaria vesca subsp. vesca]
MAETTSNQTTNGALTDLPEEILIHILSFLPTLYAVQTSLVSRQFRSLWSRVPSLDFSYDLFPSAVPDPTRLFASLVDRALLLRSISPIQTFRLSFLYYYRYSSHVDSWLRCAVTRFHARELHLDLYIDKEYQNEVSLDEMYEFPFAVLRDSRVEVLSLTRCYIWLPADMNLVSIRTVHLERIEMTDEMVRDLISGCPNLEDLEIHDCHGMENLKICSQKLKRLALGYFYDCDERNTVEIDCRNLWFLKFDCCSFTQFRLKNASCLVEFHIGIVHMEQYYCLWTKMVKLLEQAPHVKSLNVENWWLKFVISENPFPKSFKLQNVRLLELRTGYTQYDLIGMAALLALCPNLETMILDYLHKIEEDESLPEEISNIPVNLNIPRLKEVKMLKFFGSEDEHTFVTMLKKQGAALWKITLFPFKIEGNSCHQYPPVVLRRKPCQCEVTGSSSP